ncbi:MAG: hypothetical protein KC684_02205 [Candidatus Omnitrophica bacterium]|nr:hypothetical protein [Candidatus Omnitrophota bacterium]
MVVIVTFVITAVCFAVIYNARKIWVINQDRRKGIYPPQDNATLFDVRHLIMEGKVDLAVRLYREIFGVNQHEAEKAVNELQRSVFENN